MIQENTVHYNWNDIKKEVKHLIKITEQVATLCDNCGLNI